MDSCNKECTLDHLMTMGFTQHNGLKITSAEHQGATGEFDITAKHLNPLGLVHGGCLAALADTVTGAAACLFSGSSCVTVSYSMNFLRPAWGTGNKIYCSATPDKLGKTLCVYRATLTDDNGDIVASGTFTMFINPRVSQKKDQSV